MSNFDHATRTLAPPQVVAVSLLSVALIGALDYLISFKLSLALFYLGPIALATWRVGKNAGLACVGLASVIWFWAALAANPSWRDGWIMLWNGLTYTGLLLIFTLLLDALRIRHAQEQQQIRTDPVTGVPNNRALIEQLQHHLNLASRNQQPLTLAYVMLDNFKPISDVYGPAEGDRVLRVTAGALKEITRRTDVIARLGGVEFALLLPSTDQSGAEQVVEKVKQSLWRAFPSGRLKVTCSVSVVTFRASPRHVDEALKIADALMYQVKSQGGNTVAFHLVTA
jgi:diguanylate cyclase (GGDEF)-like protein